MRIPPFSVSRLAAAVPLAVFLWFGSPATAPAQVSITETKLDASARFEVTATLPAGYANAALETSVAGGAWRTVISGVVDGRAATVIFRLPRTPGGPSTMARVKAATEGAPPTAELTDPALYTVIYGSTGGQIEETVKLANLGTLMRKRDEWKGLPFTQRNDNVIAHAKTLPGVEDAGYSALTRTVYINYTDGDTSVIIDNRGEGVAGAPGPLPGPVLQLAPGAGAGPSPLQAGSFPRVMSGDIQPADPAKKLPQSIEALCAYALEPETFDDATPVVAGWLTSAGYSVRRNSAPTVDDILGWRGAKFGVVFWQTHAGSLKRNETAPEQMCISTGQRVTVELSQGRYKSMRSGPVYELLLAGREDTANPNNKEGIPIYALTEAFIQRNLVDMFAENSLSAFDACTGAHPDLANLFMANGAGAHVSWDRPSGVLSGQRFRQMFDRLIGKNEETPLASPKERPFNLQATQQWMQDYAFDLDPSREDPKHPGVATMQYRYDTDAPAFALLPSIYRVLYTARDQLADYTKLTIEGDFGQDPGDGKRLVSWGDQVMQVLKWDQDEGIVVRIPPAPHPSGSIQVFIGNHKSNLAPITQWNIPVTYTLTGKGSLQLKIEMNVRLRANIHRGREMPGEDPRNYSVVLYQLTDCSGTVTASGLYKPDPDTTITWSGGGGLVSFETLTGTPPPMNFITAAASLDPASGTVVNFALSTTALFTETVTVPGNTQTSPKGALLDGFFLPMEAKIDPSSSVLQGKTMNNPMPLFTEHGVSAVLGWPSVTPTNAPGADTVH